MNTTKRMVPRGTENLFPGKVKATTILENLGHDLKIYEKQLSGRNYNFTFTNGKYLSIEIRPEDLFQLLGFTPDRVSKENKHRIYRDLGLDDDVSHLEYMKALVENADYMVDRDYRNLPIIINYNKLDRKHKLFRTFINYDFSQFNFGLIDFSKRTFAENGFKFSRQASQLIYLKQDDYDQPFIILGALGENDDDTLEGTLETIIDPYNYPDFFNRQKVALAESFCLGDPAISTLYQNTRMQKVKELTRLFDISKAGKNQGDVIEQDGRRPLDIFVQCGEESLLLNDQGFSKAKKFIYQPK